MSEKEKLERLLELARRVFRLREELSAAESQLKAAALTVKP